MDPVPASQFMSVMSVTLSGRCEQHTRTHLAVQPYQVLDADLSRCVCQSVSLSVYLRRLIRTQNQDQRRSVILPSREKSCSCIARHNESSLWPPRRSSCRVAECRPQHARPHKVDRSSATANAGVRRVISGNPRCRNRWLITDAPSHNLTINHPI